MKDKEIINEIYENIAEELNISDSVFENAKRSYKALGEFLENNIEYPVEVYPQGSMNLGTLIKPIGDDDDYDLDAVCKIYNNFDSPKDLKELVGNALKKSERYKKMLADEGKRCWTLNYSDNSHFHMDILPSIPNNITDKSIKITHKENNNYKYMVSNPEAYADWFDKLQENERRNLYRIKNRKFSNKVEDLRNFGIRTTLQKTIQILKRHRDIQYANATDEERECKPISIIITTLVGKMYSENESIVDLIDKFCTSYEEYIEIDSNGYYVISNPVNKSENFADKWKVYPERKEAFFNWVENLKYDLITNNFMIFDDITEKTNYLKKVFGNKTIANVFEKRNSSMSERYIDRKNIATITTNKTDTKVKEHTFFGE